MNLHAWKTINEGSLKKKTGVGVSYAANHKSSNAYLWKGLLHISSLNSSVKVSRIHMEIEGRGVWVGL